MEESLSSASFRGVSMRQYVEMPTIMSGFLVYDDIIVPEPAGTREHRGCAPDPAAPWFMQVHDYRDNRNAGPDDVLCTKDGRCAE